MIRNIDSEVEKLLKNSRKYKKKTNNRQFPHRFVIRM